MIKLLLLQPYQIAHGPSICARKDTAVLEHEEAHLLTMNALSLDRGGSRANKIAHRLVASVGPELGEGNCVAPIGLNSVTWLPRNHRGSDHHARIAERCDQSMQAVPGSAGLVAKMSTVAGCGDPLHHPAHALNRGVHLADEAHRRVRRRQQQWRFELSPRRFRQRPLYTA